MNPVTEKELDDLQEKCARVTALGSGKYEKVCHNDGYISCELNNCHAFIVISEDSFEIRADALRVAKYYSACNPEFISRLISSYRSSLAREKEAMGVVKFYASNEHWLTGTINNYTAFEFIEDSDLEDRGANKKKLGGKRARELLKRWSE